MSLTLAGRPQTGRFIPTRYLNGPVRVPLLPRWARVTLAAGVAAVVLAGSLVPPPTEVGQPIGPFGLVEADAWSHALSYGVLAISVAYALLARSGERLLVAVVAAVAFGLAVEGLQYGVPWRSFELADAVANAVGALVAAGGWRVLQVGHRLERADEASRTT